MNENNFYSIFIYGEWVDVNWGIFRSWAGKRKVNGLEFFGKRFYYMSGERTK